MEPLHFIIQKLYIFQTKNDKLAYGENYNQELYYLQSSLRNVRIMNSQSMTKEQEADHFIREDLWRETC